VAGLGPSARAQAGPTGQRFPGAAEAGQALVSGSGGGAAAGWNPKCQRPRGSADELPRVFDRFWRGQAAAHTSGSGIGLAIAAEPAQAHSGTLTAASQPGQGTRLTLTVPAPERLHIAAMATAHRLHRRRLCLSHESKIRIHLQDDC
jgi:hypothetical protein